MDIYESSDSLEVQRRLYSKDWDEYDWGGERLYPVMLPLEETLRGSTARLHVPHPPARYNILGTPRSGTKWAQRIVSSLLTRKNNSVFSVLIGKIYSPVSAMDEVHHYHEGVIDDFDKDQKVLFIYRDIRDAIVSGYFYVKNIMNGGTMASTTENFKRLSFEDGLEKHIIMYMKYRMPVLHYWYNIDADNVVKVKYEEMVADRDRWVRYLNKALKINSDEDIVKRVIEETSFENMSSRTPGEEDRNSHQRKGISGDWSNHFTERHIRIFREMGGEDFLRSIGYDV